MTRKIRKLAGELKANTGVDFSRYRVPEIMDRVASMASFVSYAVPTVVTPVLLLFAANVGACYYFAVYDGWHWFGVAWFFFAGLFVVVFAGFPLGAQLLGWRAFYDVSHLMGLSLDIGVQISADVARASDRKKPVPFLDVVRGVVSVIIVPSIDSFARGRFGWIAAPGMWAVENMLFYFTRYLAGAGEYVTGGEKPKQKRRRGPPPVSEQAAQALARTADTVHKNANVVSKEVSEFKDNAADILLRFVAPKALFPFRLLTYAGLFIHGPVLYFIYWLYH